MCLFYKQILMRLKNTLIPGMDQLYTQKSTYQAHRKKLDKILQSRPKLDTQWRQVQDSALKRQSYSYQCKYNTRSLEIAHKNQQISTKISKIKSAYSLNPPPVPSLHRSPSHQRLSTQQHRQNYRMRDRILSMNSSLNQGVMMKDYKRSAQLKKQLSHFMTQHKQVKLKAQRFLGQLNPDKNKSQILQTQQSVASLPQIQDPQSTKVFIRNKLAKNRQESNAACFYRPQDIQKNRVVANDHLKIVKKNKGYLQSSLNHKNSSIKALGHMSVGAKETQNKPTFFTQSIK